MEHDLNILMIFLHKRKINNFGYFYKYTRAAYDCVISMTYDFVLQGHICNIIFPEFLHCWRFLHSASGTALTVTSPSDAQADSQ